MKAQIDTRTLSRIVDIIDGACERCPANPLDRCVRVTLIGEKLWLTLARKDLVVAAEIDAYYSGAVETGVWLLPVATLKTALDALQKSVYVEISGQAGPCSPLVITAADGDPCTLTLECFDTADAAAPAAVPAGECDISIGFTACARMIDQTVFACEAENTHCAQACVEWTVEADAYSPHLPRTRWLTMAATNRCQLSVARRGCENGGAGAEARKVLVPAQAVRTLRAFMETRRMFIDSNPAWTPVRVRMDGDWTAESQIGNATVRVWAKSGDGKFPDYQSVLPPSNEGVVATCDAGEFLGGVRRAAAFANEEHRCLRLAFGGGRIALTCRAADIGEGRAEVEAVYSGDPIKIGCDPRLLIAALRPVAAAGEIRLRMRKATQPILIETPNQSYRHVLMPVSL